MQINTLIKQIGDDFDRLEYVTLDMEPNVMSFWQAYMTPECFEQLGIDCVIDCCGYGSGSTVEEALQELINIIQDPHEEGDVEDNTIQA